ncbi:MAG: desulfoferrodoxin [Candidatus Cloacimonetes bacterium]|nr:desulfoferrodoxin [Candidatus Cloacimonadota bacterium]
MTKLRELYLCKMCGNLVEVVQNRNGDLICCGENMQLLKANSFDAANEKHVPVIEDKGDSILVTVGSVEHPMTNEHHIVFIECLTENRVYRKELKPDEKPSACFPVKRNEVKEIREFCNLHMLWKTE